MYNENRRTVEHEARDFPEGSCIFDDCFLNTEHIFALFLARTARYDDAIAIQRRLVLKARTVFGPENAKTPRYINNLANFYSGQDKLDLAELDRAMGPHGPGPLG
jgi:hypothetical protein